jgi:hypothetical protein
MSLDVYLEGATLAPVGVGDGIFVREDGQQKEISREEWDAKFPGRKPVTFTGDGDDLVYHANITHNLGKMADAAGVYKYLWRPDEIGIGQAKQLIEPLTTGLERLQADPVTFRAHNPTNGWGSYEGLVKFVGDYLDACKAYPDCTVRVWR